jgi:hypothetical protein
MAISQGLNVWHSALSTGLEFDGLDTKFGKTGILGFLYNIYDNAFVT